MAVQSVPSALAEPVARELLGERVLWVGSPQRWAYAAKYWKTSLFGIPFSAFAIFWTFEAGHIPSKAPQPMVWFFPLWGLMFVAAGMAMLLAPLFAAWAAGRVYYVVTERRAIIFEKPFQLKIHSFDASGFAGYERISGGGAGGNIIFQRSIERRGRGTRVTDVGFIGVPDFSSAQQALDKMMALRGGPARRSEML